MDRYHHYHYGDHIDCSSGFKVIQITILKVSYSPQIQRKDE